MIPKIIVVKKPDAQGKYPIVIQVVVGTTPLRKTLFKVDLKHWSSDKCRVKPSNPLYTEYNDLILTKLVEVEKRCIQAERDNLQVDAAYLFDIQKPVNKLLDVLEKYKDKMEMQKKWSAKEKYHSIIGKVAEFDSKANADQVNKIWLEKFQAFLLKGNNQNTASKTISSLLTALKDVDIPIVFQLTHKPTNKDKLSKDELFKVRDLPLTGIIAEVRDCFLLAFYLRGRRIGDILTLRQSEIKNGRVVRDARKTDKPMDILVTPQAQEIIDRYKGGYYVLPLLKLTINELAERKAIKSATSMVNRYLKIIADMAGIDKNLTTHVARHTFANLMDKSGATTKRVMDMLEHSDLNTTDIYLDTLRKSDELDKAHGEFMEWLEG